jgi:hypothetical protein
MSVRLTGQRRVRFAPVRDQIGAGPKRRFGPGATTVRCGKQKGGPTAARSLKVAAEANPTQDFV